MRVLLWPPSKQKREILLFLGVEGVDETLNHFVIKFKCGDIKVFAKKDVFCMRLYGDE
jgi:hypothetical protein